MTDTIISFETAKLAEEKKYSQKKKELFPPTQSLLQKWLREKHNIHIIIKPFYDSKTKKISWAADIIQIGIQIVKTKRLIIQFTYEEALEIALQEALKLIK